MTASEIFAAAAAGAFILNAWLLQRLIGGFDSFRRDVETRLTEYGERLARLDERHGMESAARLHSHRREGDK